MSDNSDRQFEELIQNFTAKLNRVRCSRREYRDGLKMAVDELEIMLEVAEADAEREREREMESGND